MNSSDDELLRKLREQFLSDPDEQVLQIETIASNLPNDPRGVLSDLMRAAHNLKGSSQLAGFAAFANSVHEAESIFQSLLKCSIPQDETQNCMILVRRLGTFIRKKFELLREGSEIDDRQIAAWNSTIQDLAKIAAKSPILEGTSTNSASAANEASFDDWGLDFKEPSSLQSSPVELSPKIEIADINEVKSLSSSIDISRGWGVFDDDEPKNVSVTASPAVVTEASRQAAIAGANAVHPSPAPVNDRMVSPNSMASASSTTPNPAKAEAAIERGDTYLLCHKQNATYALPVRFVQEIMPNRRLKALPIKRKQISGVISFRGQIMPVLDVISSAESQGSAQEVTTGEQQSGCIIVCQFGRKLFGFRIDQVSTVIEVKDTQLQAVQTKLDSQEKRLVSHLSQIDGRAISFLDLSAVISI